MKIGLIARADSTGLGTQAKEFFAHIPCKALVIDFQNMSEKSRHLLIPDLSAFPDQQVFHWGNKHPLTNGMPIEVIREFIQGLDILFCMETAYDYNFFELCRQKGVKTVLQLNYEFLDFPSHLTGPALFASPSMWHYDEIPEPKVFLPVPVRDFPLLERKENNFLHIAGRMAQYDRNGTQTLFKALEHVESEMTVTIKSQNPIHIPHLRNTKVTLVVDSTNKQNYLDNYTGGTLVMPRKYGGLCLPMNEAISLGMPVITTDISPNNTWLPREWLIHARLSDSFKCKKVVDVYECDPVHLAARMDSFCDPETYHRACDQAFEIKKTITWEALLPKYMETFKSLL
jgi:glycosyltransferase involved in cell wall biosynthesis